MSSQRNRDTKTFRRDAIRARAMADVWRAANDASTEWQRVVEEATRPPRTDA